MAGNPTTQFPGDMPAAPPPPPEVKVRTMRSDLDAMAKSGGGAPHFQTVAVMGLSAGKPRPAEAASAPVGNEDAKPRNTKAIMIIVIIAAVAAIAALCYLAYRIFFVGTGITGAPSAATAPVETQGSQNPVASTTTSAPAASTGTGIATTTSVSGGSVATPPAPPAGVAATTSVSAGNATVPFVHATLFKKAPDQTLTYTFSSGGAATTAQDLETFDQKISTLLVGANKNAHVIEIAMNDAIGNGVPISNILSAADASFLSPAALGDLSSDATFFAYQDQNGFWPGIVLSVRSGADLTAVDNDVQALQSSPAVANLFLSNPGAPATAGFMNSTVSSTIVWTLAFPAATPPATFIYGWYQGYLVISTSRNGFLAAINLLN